jgi:hypothetical protein
MIMVASQRPWRVVLTGDLFEANVSIIAIDGLISMSLSGSPIDC